MHTPLDKYILLFWTYLLINYFSANFFLFSSPRSLCKLYSCTQDHELHIYMVVVELMFPFPLKGLSVFLLWRKEVFPISASCVFSWDIWTNGGSLQPWVTYTLLAGFLDCMQPGLFSSVGILAVTISAAAIIRVYLLYDQMTLALLPELLETMITC